MQELRQSTQIKVVVGPVVAVGDGFTPVTTLSLSTADEAEIIKHDAGSVTSIASATFAAITGADGYYNLTITTSLSDTLGMLTVAINDDSLCLPVRERYMVLNPAAWDAKYTADGAATDTGTAQAGAAGTLTLATSAAATADLYNGMTLYLRSGTGAGQARQIHDYSAARVASVSPNWTVTPDATTVYVLVPTPPANQSEPAEVNVTQIAGTAVTGTGTSGDEWGP